MLSVSVSSNYLSTNSMVNTPVISPSTLKDDPFKSVLGSTMQTPDVIDFSLAFAPITTSEMSTGATASAVPTTAPIHTSQMYLAVPPQPITSNLNLASLQPTISSSMGLFPGSGESEHDNILLDLSPRIRNQITRPPAFPQNASSLSMAMSMSVPSSLTNPSSAIPRSALPITSSVASIASSSYSYNYQPQYSESLQQFNQDFLYPTSVGRQTHRNVTHTVSRPTDSPITSYDFSVTNREEMMSSDSNTIDYFHESTDRNIFAQYEPQTRSPSPQPIPSSSFSELSEDTPHVSYLSLRHRNNTASKKFRSSKRDQQKQMEKQIQYYLEDNQRCHKLIARMEKEIECCKQILFKNFKKN